MEPKVLSCSSTKEIRIRIHLLNLSNFYLVKCITACFKLVQSWILVLVHGPGQIQNSWSRKDQSWCYNPNAPTTTHPQLFNINMKVKWQKIRKRIRSDVILYPNQHVSVVSIISNAQKSPSLCHTQAQKQQCIMLKSKGEVPIRKSEKLCD